MTDSANKPIIILTLLEIVCLILLISLIKLVSKALDQYNATRDAILKSHAAFLGLYLFIKAFNTLMQILRYKGTIIWLQDERIISVIAFLNDLSVVFFYIACSLNLYKWLVIINRVYLYAGCVTEQRFKMQKRMNVVLYVFFVVTVAGANIAYMGVDLVGNINFENQVDQDDTMDKFDEQKVPKSDQQKPILVFGFIFILAITSFSNTVIGSCLVHQLRKYYKENYYQHSNSIILSIVLVIVSTAALIGWNSIKISNLDIMIDFESNKHMNDSWKYHLTFLGMEILGQYFPIAMQLICLYVSIVGNWNELLQAQLAVPDQDVTLNSYMFRSFFSNLNSNSLLKNGIDYDKKAHLAKSSVTNLTDKRVSILGKSERLRSNTLITASSLPDDDSHFGDILITGQQKKNRSKTFVHDSPRQQMPEGRIDFENSEHGQKSISRMHSVLKHLNHKEMRNNAFEDLSEEEIDDSQNGAYVNVSNGFTNAMRDLSISRITKVSSSYDQVSQ